MIKKLPVAALLVLSVFAMGIAAGFYGISFTSAFEGPPGTAGEGTGAISSDSANNVSIGTTTFPGNVRLYVVGSNTATSSLRVFGAIESVSGTIAGGFRFPDGTVQTTAATGGDTVSAANVSSGDFGSNTGAGNYSFPAALSVGTTTANEELHIVPVSGWPGIVLNSSAAANQGAEIHFINDARFWKIGLDGSDNFRIRDNTAGTNVIYIDTSGEVGIGGLSDPGYQLEVLTSLGKSAVNIQADSAAEVALRLQNTHALGNIWRMVGGVVGARNDYFSIYNETAGATPFVIDTSGNVGIGTTGPGQKLTVAGTVESTSGGFKFPDGTTQTTASAADINYWRLSGSSLTPTSTSYNLGVGTTTAINPLVVYRNDTNTANPSVEVAQGSTGDSQMTFRIPGLTWAMGIDNSDSDKFKIDDSGAGFASPEFAMDTSGFVTPNGGYCLGVSCLTSWSPSSGYVARWTSATALGAGSIQDDGSTVGIGGAPGGLRLTVNGGIEAAGAVIPNVDNGVGYALGQSAKRWREAHAINFYGAYNAGPDVAERYLSAEELEPGDLVAKDTDRAGYWVKRAEPGEDKLLMGVVSTAPGVILSEPQEAVDGKKEFSEEGYPIALVGRIPVKVSADNGPIAIGDYLTLSVSEPGVAVKLTGVGKAVAMALEPYSGSGVGKVLGFVGGPRDILIAPAPGPISVAEFLRELRDKVLRVKEVIAERLTVGTVATDGLEMKDRATGEVYCVQIVNGEFENVKGDCE